MEWSWLLPVTSEWSPRAVLNVPGDLEQADTGSGAQSREPSLVLPRSYKELTEARGWSARRVTFQFRLASARPDCIEWRLNTADTDADVSAGSGAIPRHRPEPPCVPCESLGRHPWLSLASAQLPEVAVPPLPAHSNAPRGWGGCCGGLSAGGWGSGGDHLYSPSRLLFGVFGDTEFGEWFLAEKQLESALFPPPNWRRRVCAVGGPFRIRPPASAVKPFGLVLRGFLRGVTGKTVGALSFRGGRGALCKLIWEHLRKVVGGR